LLSTNYGNLALRQHTNDLNTDSYFERINNVEENEVESCDAHPDDDLGQQEGMANNNIDNFPQL